MPTNFLTRIKNNQITDSTIFANTKIYPGSIVGSLFNANLTMTSDVTITGNLTVQGSSTYLTVASTNTYVNDPLIILNNAFSGTNTYDIGFLINRGNQIATALIWNEASKSFQLINTTDDGTTYGVINNSGFANLKVGNLTVEYASTINSLTTSGDINAVNVNLSGDLLIGGGDLTANTSTFNLLNSTVTTLNFAGAGTNIVVGATTGTFNLRNANIYLPNATTVYSGQTTVALMNEVPTTINAFGVATALNIGATSGTLSARNANIWLPNATSVNGAQATIGLFNTASTVNAFQGATGANIGATSGTLTINNPTVVGTQPTQNLYNTVATTLNFAGAATSLVVGATTGVTNIRSGNIYLPNMANIASTQGTIAVFNTDSTTVNAFGAATTMTLGATTGTASIRNANIWLPNATTVDGAQTSIGVFNRATTVNAFTGATTANIGAGSGTLTINNPTVIGLQAVQSLYNTVTETLNFAGAATTLTIGSTTGTANIRNAKTEIVGNLQVDSTVQSTTYSDGAVTVAGGVGITKDLNVGGNVDVTGVTTVTNTAEATGPLSAALIVYGGIAANANSYFGANVTIDGNLIVNGNVTYINANNLNINDSMIYLADDNPADTLDIGIISSFTSDKYQHTGFVRDASDGVWKLFANVVPEPTTTVDFTNANYSTLKVGNLVVVSDTTSGNLLTLNSGAPSTSTSTGALVITAPGGIGLGGNLWLGGPDLATSASTLNVINTNATTVNAFGAATSLNLGSTSGTLTLRNPTVVGTESTQNLYNTVATTVNAFGAATALNFGANTGTLTLRSPTVVGTETTQNLYNTVATTLNFGGNATSVVAGATTGTFNIRNANLYLPNATTIFSGQSTLSFANTVTQTLNIAGAASAVTIAGVNSVTNLLGNANIKATTPSTTSTTGALVVNGGTGIVGNLNVNGLVRFTNTTDSIGYADGAILANGGLGVAGNINVNSASHVLVGGDLIGNLVYTENMVQVTGNVSNLAARVTIQNINTEPGSVAEFMAMSDNGSNLAFYTATGITNSNFDKGYFIKQNEGFTYSTGNLSLFTLFDKVTVAAGGFDDANIIATFNNTTSNVSIVRTTQATSPTTGALTIAGGVGIAGNIWVANGAVFNNSQTSDNFTIKGVTTTALFYADSNKGAVVIGGAGSSSSGGNTNIPGGTRLKIDSTDTIILPTGTTAQRPSNTGNVDIAGMLRYNTTTNLLEFYNGSQWAGASGEISYNIITSEQFNGDGANLSFTLNQTSTTNSTIVSINGILQIPTISYSIAGANLTFTEAPAAGDVVDVRHLTTTLTVSQLASDAGWQIVAPTDTSGVELYSGNGAPVLRAVVSKDGAWSLVNGTKTTYDQTAVNVSANATPIIIDSFVASSYTTAKYIVQIKNGTAIQSMESLLVHDNSNVFLNTFSIVDTSGDIGTLSGNIVSGNVRLYYTSTSLTNSNVKVYSTYIV